MPAMPKDKTSPISLRESNFTELKLKDQLATPVTDSDVSAAAAAMVNSATGPNASTMAASNRLQQQQLNRSICGCGAASVDDVDSSYNRQNYSEKYGNLSPLAVSVASTGNATVLFPKNLACCRTKQHHCNVPVDCATTDNETEATSNSNKLTSASTPPKKTPYDFIFGKYIGEGSFSIVYLAVDVQTKKEYAIKVCEKRHILREHKQEYIRREREVMHIMTNVPGFVNLSCTFQDNRSLYFVMTYAKNGDLLPYINKVGSFDVDCTRHYAAELVLACEQMHRRNVVHRDLKPENILLDENMHTMIADFGSAKILTSDEGTATSSELLPNSPTSSSMRHSNLGSSKYEDDKSQDTGSDDNVIPNRISQHQRFNRKRKGSFVGTAQYVSPEVLQNGPITASADLWALGCIVYQMISGLPPFRGTNDYVIFKEILACDLEFPQGFNKNAEDLVRKLLRIEPEDRLGAQDKSGRYDSIRTHPFFECVNFDSIRQQTPPTIYPFLPGVSKEEDYRSHYLVPENLQPGLDDKQLTRLLGMELGTALSGDTTMQGDIDIDQKTLTKNIFDISLKEKHLRLEQQKTDKWHVFADNEVILKKGYVNKRKGLFARKRMMLLTTGPRLIYIDPVQMVKKGEIPWSHELRVEAKNFKIFFVHTPNRTYYLEDPEGYSLQWVSAIENMRKLTYKDQVAMFGTQLTTPASSAIKTSSA